MSSKNGSSIRKKIVYGYMRIYCVIALMLFVLFVVASYFISFYVAQEYVSMKLESVMHEVTTDRQNQSMEDMYLKAQSLMPDYVMRYDVLYGTMRIKEEEYYDSAYYYSKRNEQKNETATATPTPDAGESEVIFAGYITSEVLYLREKPEISARAIYQLGYGIQLDVVGDYGDWYKVSYDGDELYCVSKFISRGPMPTPTPERDDEFWRFQSIHLFSASGTEYTTEKGFDSSQTGNAFTSLEEPYIFYISAGIDYMNEDDDAGYVLNEYYSIKAVVDITEVVSEYIIWTAAGLTFVFIFIMFVMGLLMVWVYGASKTRKYLKPIDEITKLASEIQPNSQYRLNVNTAKYELKELVITINSMLDRLNAAHVKRKKFVSDVSHELRTPISVITGYANMLKRWAKDDEEVFDESVDAIIEESSNMKYLVENLLFLARSDNDQNVYDMEPFDISSLIESIAKDAKMVDKGKHEIIFDVAPGIIVNGDRNRLKQAIREFLLNAVKYTPPMGQVKLTLQKVGSTAIINIEDTGIGISKKDLGHIFSRFYRGDMSRNRDKGGYGLGLAICREIISAHKGKITIKSKEGSGTSVTVTLSLS